LALGEANMQKYLFNISLFWLLSFSTSIVAQEMPGGSQDKPVHRPGRGMAAMSSDSSMSGSMGMRRGMMIGKNMMSMMGMMDPVVVKINHFGSPCFLMSMATQLNLSDQQINNLRTLRSSYMKTMIHSCADYMIAQADLADLFSAANPDYAAIKKQLANLGTIENTMRLNEVDAVQKGRAVLNANQLTKLQSMSGFGKCDGMME
jgi:hypothetical protein